MEDEIVEGNTEDEMSTEEEDFGDEVGDDDDDYDDGYDEAVDETKDGDEGNAADQLQQGLGSRPVSRALSGPMETLPTLMENDDAGEDGDADDEDENDAQMKAIADDDVAGDEGRTIFSFEEEAPPLPIAIREKSGDDENYDGGGDDEEGPPPPPPSTPGKLRENKRSAAPKLNFETLMEDDRWFYIIAKFGKEEMGPCSCEDLLKWAAQGLFPSNVLVRHGATKW